MYCQLFLVFTSGSLAFLNRFFVGVVAPLIKADLGISDSSLGFVFGPAFSIPYLLSAPLLGHVLDSNSVSVFISLSVTLLGVTFLCTGLASTLSQLIAYRTMTGFLEAIAFPALILAVGNLFGPERRSFGMSIFMAILSFSNTASSWAGGAISALYGWRAVFVGAGTLQVGLGLIDSRYLADVPRARADFPESPGWRPTAAQSEEHLTMREAILTVMRMPCVWLMALANGAHVGGEVGVVSWRVLFFERSHGLSAADVGPLLVAMSPLVVVNLLAVGWAADALAMQLRDGRAPVWLASALLLAALPLWILSLSQPRERGHAAAIAQSIAFAISTGQAPLTLSVVLQIVPPNVRATATGLFMSLSTLISMSAPQVIGSLSDWYRSAYGQESLRAALLVTLATLESTAVLVLLLASMLFPRSDRPQHDKLVPALI